jgi:hypothetical protein
VAFVGRARDSVEFSPKDSSQVAAFLVREREAKQVRVVGRGCLGTAGSLWWEGESVGL